MKRKQALLLAAGLIPSGMLGKRCVHGLIMKSKVSVWLLVALTVLPASLQARVKLVALPERARVVQAGDEMPLQREVKQRMDSAAKGIAQDSTMLGLEATRRAGMATPSPIFSFRASGMNRTLKQQIEIQATIGSPAALVQPPQSTVVGGITAGRAMPARGSASRPAATTPLPLAAPPVTSSGSSAGSRSPSSSAPASNTVLLQGTATTATGQQIPIQAARISATK